METQLEVKLMSCVSFNPNSNPNPQLYPTLIPTPTLTPYSSQTTSSPNSNPNSPKIFPASALPNPNSNSPQPLSFTILIPSPTNGRTMNLTPSAGWAFFSNYQPNPTPTPMPAQPWLGERPIVFKCSPIIGAELLVVGASTGVSRAVATNGFSPINAACSFNSCYHYP